MSRKREFLNKASFVFDDSREDNLREKLASERKEKEQYAKKVGQLSLKNADTRLGAEKLVDS